MKKGWIEKEIEMTIINESTIWFENLISALKAQGSDTCLFPFNSV